MKMKMVGATYQKSRMQKILEFLGLQGKMKMVGANLAISTRSNIIGFCEIVCVPL